MHYRIPVYNYFSRRFHDHGWELTVRSNELEPQNRHRIEFDFQILPLSFAAYKAEVERLEPDVVITFLRLKDIMVWPLVHWLKARGTPVAFWMKAMNYDRPDSVTSRLLYAYVHGIVDGLILYSSHELALLNRRTRRKAFAANNTVNFESFPAIADSKEDIKRLLGIPFDKVVLSVGRMGAGGQRKKVHHLIEIFKEIDEPGVGLVIVGSGMTPGLVASLNEKNTVCLGEVHDAEGVQIGRIFKMADVFSIPGHVGLGLNQAFYWGLPVVTEHGAQPPEIHYLVDGRNGFIVGENDRAALKAKILTLLRDDALRAELGRNAREDILANGSIEGMFQGFLTCVRELSAGGPRGSRPAVRKGSRT